jgi:multidrug efflux pump subunit AcrA (membrane-fusion protein)
LRAEIDVPNEQGRLRPGMYVYADVKVAERKDALVLPHTALMQADGKTYCWQIDEQGTVVRTMVTTGIRSGGEVEIVDGLKGAEKVIGVNPTSFREGQIVEVADPTPATAAK